jgi:hypothetical protein
MRLRPGRLIQNTFQNKYANNAYIGGFLGRDATEVNGF